MFISAIVCLLLGFMAAVCGYGGLASTTSAVLAQHAFLLCLTGFGVCASMIIFGVDQAILQLAVVRTPARHASLDR